MRSILSSPVLCRASIGIQPSRGHPLSVVSEKPAIVSGHDHLSLSAIRRLARECAENGLLNPELANGIVNVRSVKRLGNWLTVSQAQKLLSATGVGTLLGKRDTAMLALLVGCGLRRAELVGLQLNQLQRREDHWVIVDLVGKGDGCGRSRFRTGANAWLMAGSVNLGSAKAPSSAVC